MTVVPSGATNGYSVGFSSEVGHIYDVNGAPSMTISTRRSDSCGVTTTPWLAALSWDAVAAGVVTDEELDELVSGVSAAAARGEAFVSVTMFGVIGRRPR